MPFWLNPINWSWEQKQAALTVLAAVTTLAASWIRGRSIASAQQPTVEVMPPQYQQQQWMYDPYTRRVVPMITQM